MCPPRFLAERSQDLRLCSPWLSCGVYSVKCPSDAISHVSTGALGLGKNDDKTNMSFLYQIKDACHCNLEHLARVMFI